MSLNLNDIITFDDVQRVAMLNYIAIEITPYLEYDVGEMRGIRGEFDLTNQKKLRNELNPFFEFSRQTIRDYIIQLTGAKMINNELTL